jgi:3-oxoacyl-[acyl-carrier-protein] synthase-1
MREVWVARDNIVSPLGKSSKENYKNLQQGITGLQRMEDPAISSSSIMAGRIPDIQSSSRISNFEAIGLEALSGLLQNISLPPDRTLFILSTTKGNIRLLEEGKVNHERIHLHATSAYLAGQVGYKNHIIVSNACISGVMAIIVAKRFLQSGKYDHAVILGADSLSHFIVSGFQSLQALSNELCKPFDKNRKGINLGEAAAAILLTTNPDKTGGTSTIKISGGGLSNDANHISGPSRTGEELSMAIHQALAEAGVTSKEIDFVSAHGTATLYNDEMESKAFHLAGLNDVPVNSLKGYFGHTLGAAGILETIISIHSLLNNELIPTKGFDQPGVSQPINVIQKLVSTPLAMCLKTASGFGGCNAALMLQKIIH